MSCENKHPVYKRQKQDPLDLRLNRAAWVSNLVDGTGNQARHVLNSIQRDAEGAGERRGGLHRRKRYFADVV